jgi:hypothetical protein
VAKSRRVPDDTDDDPRPRKKSRPRDEDDDQPMRPRKKKKSAAGPMRKAVMIGGAVLGSIGLFFLLFWIYTPVGVDSAMLCYCPPETISIEGMDVEELSKIPQIKEMTDSVTNVWKTANDKRLAPGGIKDTDVTKFLLAHVNGSGDTSVEPQQRRGTLTVLRLKNSIDPEKFVAGYSGGTSVYRLDEQTGPEGKKFYQLYQNLAGGRQDDVSFYFPNDRTLVMGSTRRETEEAMKRRSGKVEIDGDMRELANTVDGHFFSAHVTPTATSIDGGRFAYNLNITSDAETKPPTQAGGSFWYASDGNYLLYGEGILMSDRSIASDVRSSMSRSFAKARNQIMQQESKPGGVEEVFFPKSPNGQSTGGSGKADIVEGIIDYIKHSKVYRRDRLVVVEGKINAELFMKMWSGISGKFLPNRGGMGRGF